MKQLILFVSCCFLAVFQLSAQNVWYPVDSMNGPPKSVTTSFVLQGEGYVVGGLTDVDFTRKMYSYDPSTDDWDDELSWGGESGGGQNRGSACGFVANEKAYVGLGQGNSAGFYNDFWEYDPETATWTQKADFIGTPRRNAVAFSVDDIGYVGTGQDMNGLTNDFFSYDATTNSWSQVSDFPGTPRKNAVGFAMGGDGFIGTGDDGIVRNDFWQYHPATDTWLQRADFPGGARAGAVGWGNFPTAFICSGEDANGNFKKDLWEYNFYGNMWVQRSDLPGPPRKHATAFVINGTAYVGSGFNGIFLDDFYQYNQILGTESPEVKAMMVYPNPTTDFLSISGTLSLEQVRLTDATGNMLSLSLENGHYDVRDLAPGTYFLSVTGANGQLSTRTFVKE